MLPLPPVIAWTLAAIGAAALSKVLVKDRHRVNTKLDVREAASRTAAADHARTLRRDPNTGVYRPD
jgi:hypothetical protein